MKAYLMSIPDSIQGVSETLNVKASLCGKTWRLFNDEDLKVVFIFQKDGSIIMSQNGVATKSRWEYIKANKAILIEDDSQMLLLHPTFVDDVLFVLQQDGTNDYIILIDESKFGKLMLMTIEAIGNYLKNVSGGEKAIQEEQERLIRKQAQEEAQDEIKQATANLCKKQKMIHIITSLSVCLCGLIIYIGLDTILSVVGMFLAVICMFAWLYMVVSLDKKMDLIKDKIVNRHIEKLKNGE